jgi:inner membrane protein
MTLQLRGSQNISFLPLGRKTEARISSTWKSPSFSGAFLPQNRIINEKSFEAQWEIFEYNRQYPQQWANTSWNFYSSSFGIDFFIPVDEYQKITRSIKYSILFISLTFLAFFVFFELFNKKRIHPIQYLLVGLALCLFYLLLVSLSEHMAFDKAYGISGFGIIALTTIYTWSMSQKRYLSVLMGMIITGLYGFLYVTLSMEDYALLMGSMGLFVILAAVMIGTRKIDWYSFKMGTDSRLPVAADNGLKGQDSTLD